MTSKKTYDCKKCPGYCCTYPFIEVSKTDIKRLAKHFGLEADTAEKRFTYYDKDEKALGLRKQKDPVFGTACRFFDVRKRQCTVYEARPSTCRDYPYGKTCGYYQFLKFERSLQDDKKFIALTS
jgi:Fe-S-cluster containining protein